MATKSSNPSGIGGVLRLGIVLLAVAVIGWRIVVVNLSGQLVRTGSEESVKRAVAWAPGNPSALYERASDLAVSDPEQAEQLLLQAIWRAPTRGRTLSLLGQVLERQGQAERAEWAMLTADKLAPRSSAVQAELTEYWGRRNQAEPYLRHMVTVAELDYRYGRNIQPGLLAVVDSPEYATLVREVLSDALADQDPFWWKPFFRYASGAAKTIDAVRLLYGIRLASYQKPGAEERRQFLARLERDGQWVEAYFLWLNSLPKERLDALGNVYNGAFSYPLLNEGFGWRYDGSGSVDIGIAAIDGASDGSALRLRFGGESGQASQLSQYMMLPAGGYVFSGRVRGIGIGADQGGRWRIDCVSPHAQALAQTDYSLRDSAWQVFTTQLVIPREGCEVQQLRFEQKSVTNQRKRARGTLWFDDFSVRNLD